MATKDPRIDAYIEKAAPFAQPILKHLRALVHKGCPDIEETMKWSFPHFVHNGILCSMASFKAHCTFGFWKGDLIVPPEKQVQGEGGGMGQFGRLASLGDLPPDKVILGYIAEGVRLNAAGIKKQAPPKPKERAPLVIPADLIAALKKNAKAKAAFEKFSYSHQKEYVEWITEAKRPETRAKRLETTVEWLAEGKSRNWKYANC